MRKEIAAAEKEFRKLLSPQQVRFLTWKRSTNVSLPEIIILPLGANKKIERFLSENDDEKKKERMKKKKEEGKLFLPLTILKQLESLLFAPSFEIEICLCS